jgi:putative addiction module CopG family antidote
MTYQIPPDVEQLIREQMAAGDYHNHDEVLRDALQALAERNADLAAVRTGIDDMKSGRLRPIKDVADDIRREFDCRFEHPTCGPT